MVNIKSEKTLDKIDKQRKQEKKKAPENRAVE